MFQHSQPSKDVLFRKVCHLADGCAMEFERILMRQDVLWVGWNPPPPSFIKVNLDGSSIGNPGNAGFGGPLWHLSDEWIMGFSRHVPRVDSLCVELLAL